MNFIVELISNNATTLLTAITVILLFYYTKETFLLRKESQRQTQSQFTPYLSLRNLEDGATLSNLGKGIALHVQIDPSTQIKSQPILIIPSIGAGENRVLYHMSKQGNGAFTISAKELPDNIIITYSDVMGNKYKASFLREYQGMGVFKEVKQNKL